MMDNKKHITCGEIETKVFFNVVVILGNFNLRTSEPHMFFFENIFLMLELMVRILIY